MTLVFHIKRSHTLPQDTLAVSFIISAKTRSQSSSPLPRRSHSPAHFRQDRLTLQLTSAKTLSQSSSPLPRHAHTPVHLRQDELTLQLTSAKTGSSQHDMQLAILFWAEHSQGFQVAKPHLMKSLGLQCAGLGSRAPVHSRLGANRGRVHSRMSQNTWTEAPAQG